MSRVRLENVSKQFPDGTIAVDRVSLEVEDREFLVLVGPSGCGKSTTLRMIAGLETLTGGTISIGERVVNKLAPKDRDIAMVFQNYALYPHMSVYNNLSFGLRLRFGGGFFARVIRRLVKPDRAAELNRLRCGIDWQVRQTASRLGIEKLLDRKPHQLSGGERQRVALGRAIVRNPAAFLFDEPLSNLDAKLRGQMRVELRRLHRELGATMIYVTHDQIEAMTLGDRVAVMNGGRILQIGSPLSLYQRPVDLFVARFIGNVPINLQTGTVVHRDGRNRFESSGVNFDIDPETVKMERLPASVTIGFRSEDIEVRRESDGPSGDMHCAGRIVTMDLLGDSANLHVAIDGRNENDAGDLISGNGEMLVVKTTTDASWESGESVKMKIRKDRVLWFDAESGRNLMKDRS